MEKVDEEVGIEADVSASYYTVRKKEPVKVFPISSKSMAPLTLIIKKFIFSLAQWPFPEHHDKKAAHMYLNFPWQKGLVYFTSLAI